MGEDMDDIATTLVGSVDDGLDEALETLRAIRADKVDAFVVATPSGNRVVLTDRGVERPYRAMVDGMSEGAATVAPDGTVLYANRRLAEMLATPVERIVASSFFDFIDVPRHSMLRAAFDEGAVAAWRGDVTLRAADAADVPAHLSLTSLSLGGDRLVLSVLLTDLREQKRTDAIVAAGQLAQRILDQASEAIVVCDETGIVRQVNREALRLCGDRDPHGMAFTEAFELQYDDGERGIAGLLAGDLDEERARLRCGDETRCLRVSASRLNGAESTGLGAVVTMTDLTDLHAAAEERERHMRQQRCTARLGHAALSGRSLPELARQCAISIGELVDGVDVTLTGALAAADEGRASDEPVRHPGVVRRTIRAGGRVLGRLAVDPGEGRTLAEDDLGFVDNLVGLLGLAAEQEVLHDRLRHQAHHDALTGLPNRVLLEDRLQQAMAQASRDGTSVAVLFIDLDRFKLINDTLGHQAGNAVLVQVGQRLREHSRDADTVSRLGGDEFVLVQGGLRSAEDASDVARHVTRALARPFNVSGRTVRVRATVGISTFPRDGVETAALITKSDTAMYHGKRGGRNTVRFFREPMNELSAARIEMEHDFQVALSEGQLELHFQPQVCPRTGFLRGLEALARWRHPKLGWIPPTRFVPVAEEAGLVVDLGTWALNEACRQASRWIGSPDAAVRVSVNISPTHFARPDFVDSVREALQRSGLQPRHLELEVTESIMMHDVDTVTRGLSALRELGVAIALDDFGLGYSSVSYLHNLPLDRLKIDKSFVDGRAEQAGSRHDQWAVLSAITTMAQALGLQVTVEGVETSAQLAMARDVGSDEVQGFLFDRPVPASGVDELLGQWRGRPTPPRRTA